MKFKALEKIDGYKVGDTVPMEKALIWEKMYKVSPVERIETKVNKVEDSKVEEPKIEKPKKKGLFK